jgi:hypothetical protein
VSRLLLLLLLLLNHSSWLALLLLHLLCAAGLLVARRRCRCCCCLVPVLQRARRARTRVTAAMQGQLLCSRAGIMLTHVNAPHHLLKQAVTAHRPSAPPLPSHAHAPAAAAPTVPLRRPQQATATCVCVCVCVCHREGANSQAHARAAAGTAQSCAAPHLGCRRNCGTVGHAPGTPADAAPRRTRLITAAGCNEGHGKGCRWCCWLLELDECAAAVLLLLRRSIVRARGQPPDTVARGVGCDGSHCCQRLLVVCGRAPLPPPHSRCDVCVGAVAGGGARCSFLSEGCSL